MNEDLTKICRICLTEGSRNIFQRAVAHDALYNVSSLSRISEKLRYVTLLKIDEMENLPPMICDLCIVQLNVAYNFKRQASESDTKLRQYLIENGIDIMKDPLSLPAPIVTSPPPAPSKTTSSILRPAIAAAPIPRTIARINSTASSAVLEIRPINQVAGPLQQQQQQHQHQLRPIRIKVETPETATEQSSDGGDLLSNSEISPLSSVTSTAVPIHVVTESATGISKPVTVESSPATSKANISDRSNGGGAMVVVSSENVSMHGDEDFVQNILGSNSSLASQTTESDKHQKSAASKDQANSSSSEQSKKRDPLKKILSKLAIDMVSSAKFPKSKLRTKPKKPHKSVVNTAINKSKRHTLDYSKLFAKRARTNDSSPATADSPDRRRNPVARRSASNVISANKLRSLGEKLRAEKDLSPGGKKSGDEPKRRKTLVQVESTEVAKGDGPPSSRVSLP